MSISFTIRIKFGCATWSNWNFYSHNKWFIAVIEPGFCLTCVFPVVPCTCVFVNKIWNWSRWKFSDEVPRSTSESNDIWLPIETIWRITQQRDVGRTIKWNGGWDASCICEASVCKMSTSVGQRRPEKNEKGKGMFVFIGLNRSRLAKKTCCWLDSVLLSLRSTHVSEDEVT